MSRQQRLQRADENIHIGKLVTTKGDRREALHDGCGPATFADNAVDVDVAADAAAAVAAFAEYPAAAVVADEIAPVPCQTCASRWDAMVPTLPRTPPA